MNTGDRSTRIKTPRGHDCVGVIVKDAEFRGPQEKAK